MGNIKKNGVGWNNGVERFGTSFGALQRPEKLCGPNGVQKQRLGFPEKWIIFSYIPGMKLVVAT